jgi:hypothetical protein
MTMPEIVPAAPAAPVVAAGAEIAAEAGAAAEVIGGIELATCAIYVAPLLVAAWLLGGDAPIPQTQTEIVRKPGSKPPKLTRRDDTNVMRVQLQRDNERLASTIAVIAQASTGVTTRQIRDAMQQIYSNAAAQTLNYEWFPFASLGPWLRSAIIQLSQELKRYPPGGVFGQNLNILRRETIFRGRDYRLDIENISGHNLRQ